MSERAADSLIVSVFPELGKPGGIQRLGGHVALAQQLAARSSGMQTRFLSLNDPVGPQVLAIGDHRVEYEGFGGNKGRFAFAVAMASRRARLLHVGHVFLSPMLLAARTLNRQLITHVHIFGIDVWSRRSALQRMALARSTWIVSISDYTLARMREVQDVEPRNSAMIFPPLDPGFLSMPVGSESPLPEITSKRFVLTVARLATTEKFKGVRTAIDGFARVAGEFPDVQYVIAGGGNDVENLRAYAAERGLADRVVLPGRISDEALRWLYAHCEAFVLPSAKEGFGIVFLEAMSFSKPCIGGNTGGTPEIVVEGETGFLVGWDDTDAITRATRNLLGDEELREAFGRAGRRRLDEVFTFEIFAQRMAELIDKSLGRQTL